MKVLKILNERIRQLIDEHIKSEENKKLFLDIVNDTYQIGWRNGFNEYMFLNDYEEYLEDTNEN